MFLLSIRFNYKINVIVVYHVTIVAIGHGLLKKFWPLVLGCVLRTAGSSIIVEQADVGGAADAGLYLWRWRVRGGGGLAAASQRGAAPLLPAQGTLIFNI